LLERFMDSYSMTCLKIIGATEKLVVGNTYFLSLFADQKGASVKVLSKSTKQNTAGWPSSVEVEVIEPIGAGNLHLEPKFAPGTRHIVSASELYTNREDARKRHFRRAGPKRAP
jgi:hypothetical protein